MSESELIRIHTVTYAELTDTKTSSAAEADKTEAPAHFSALR